MIFGHYQHFTILMIIVVTPSLQAQEYSDVNYDEAIGLEIMHEVYKRHRQYAFIYEEQSMVMMDRNGYRDTRKVKRYSRVEEDGTVKFLLLFDSPDEISGVALLANRDASGEIRKYIYLPAFGKKLIENISSGRDGKFLGTDFSIENLAGEVLDDYIYIRKPDKKLNNIEYFVIDVYQRDEGLSEDLLTEEKQAIRRHFISKNNFYITRTDYFNKQGRVFKKQTHYDLKPVDGMMWRSNMILMEDSKEGHQSLIKINRRVFSRDYVSAEIFTEDWLFKHYPFVKLPDVDDEEFISEDEDAEVIPDDYNNSTNNIDIEIEAIQ